MALSVYTKGRFANSTWQQMAAWVYAKKHGLEYSAPKQSLAPNVWPTYHQHLQNPSWDDSLEIVEVNDGKHSYTELPFKEEWRDKNIMIGTKSVKTGYFQSWRYVDGYEKSLVDTFFPSREYKYAIYGEKMDWVGIHVRRGDYLLHLDKHPPVTYDYLKGAISYLVNKGLKNFVFFSDDILWCKEFSYRTTWPGKVGFKYSENQSEEFDFKAMMLVCSHLIVSNSSFSVLAAILNPNPEKIIVCPHESNYFGQMNNHLSTEDIMPTSWHRIKY